MGGDEVETSKIPSKAPVANPYLRKEMAPVASIKPSHSKNESYLSVGDENAATFDQAFSAVEDTSHYQSEIAQLRTSSRNSGSSTGFVKADELKAQEQQRSFDAIAAAESAQEITARDHHVMLQPHVLHVSTKQRGNGILKYIRNVPFEYGKMVPDYVMSPSRCALFLSCKYHSLYPSYIHRRIAELKKDFALRILLVLVDVEDNANTLLFLNKLAVSSNMTLILAWTEEEAARYLETYKSFDGKDASSIQKREQTQFSDQIADVLSTVKSVNKTDSAQLLDEFSSLRSIAAASIDQLMITHGLGPTKVRRLYDALHKPFSSRAAKRRKRKNDADRVDKATSDQGPVPNATDEIEASETEEETLKSAEQPTDGAN